MIELKAELERVQVKHECVKEAIRYILNWANSIKRPDQVIPQLWHISGVRITKITKCRNGLNVEIARDLMRLFETFFMWLNRFGKVNIEKLYYHVPALLLELKFDFGLAVFHWIFDYEEDVVEVVYYYFDSTIHTI